jgi:hypothetical protein
MDRDSMNDRASAALGPQTRELTDVELDAVSGMRKAGGDPLDAFSTIGSATGGAGVTAVIAII